MRNAGYPPVQQIFGEKFRLEAEERFLGRHYRGMPRTMLRYDMERFPEEKCQAYLRGTV